MSETIVNGKWPLPEGWVEISFDDAVELVSVSGRKVQKGDYQLTGALPIIDQGQEFIGGYSDDPSMALDSKPPLIVFGDHTRVFKYIGFPFAAGADGIKVLKPRNYFDSKFLYYALSNLDLPNKGYSRHFQYLRKVTLPLPPLNVQHRIVAEIEKQFTRLDAAVAALKRAKANLARYKAAVLKAAVEGRLVAQDAADEPASELLGRILAERRAQWEAANPKKPYVEPKRPNVDGLPELPAGWVWATLSQLSNRITDGTHQPPQFVDDGIPFIFVQHIVGGSITFKNTKFITQETYERLNNRCPVEVGDILYTAVGSYGVAVPVQTKERFSFQRHIAHIKLASAELASYLVVFLNSSLGLEQAHLVARGVAQKTVTLGDLTKFVIALPPLKEQLRIVTEVERQLSILRANERVIDSNLARAERLRQEVLGKAFRGSLVQAIDLAQ